jgi:hypothetical protein
MAQVNTIKKNGGNNRDHRGNRLMVFGIVQ